jgi:DNA-binding LacI/PurR family transcriptional regulator/signal transduction histidine kinase
MTNKKIAFILDCMDAGNVYQLSLLEGVLSALPEQGVELTVVVGGPVGNYVLDPHSDERNKIYELITKDRFEGIIVATTIGTFASHERLSRYFAQYDGIPIVFLGAGPPDSYQILVDSRKGMEAIVRHFVREHHRQRIAFITGPEGNSEAEARFQAYRSVLIEAGLPFDPDLVYHGHFMAQDGMKAIVAFLDERKVSFDSIIASNDQMALSAIQQLDRRGVQIPSQIAAAGFDDTMEASSSLPALTTVRQPFQLMAKKVFEKIIALIDGSSAARTEMVPPELIIRQSCGCLSGYDRKEKPASGQFDWSDAEVFFKSQKTFFLQELENISVRPHAEADKKEAEDLFDSLFHHLLFGQVESLMAMIYRTLSTAAKRNADMVFFQEALNLAQKLFSPLLTPGPMLEEAENNFHTAQMIAKDIQIAQKKREILEGLRHREQVSIMSETLANIVEIPQLSEMIYTIFPVRSIRNFLLAEYVPGDEGMEKASLIAFIKDGIGYRGEAIVYPPAALFPRDDLMFDSKVYFIFPLLCQGTRLGYVIFDDDEGKRTSYFTLARDLAKSLFMCHLIQKRKDAEENLRFRNQELQDFAHIASHDLQEPLRKIMVFGEKLSRSLPEKTGETELNYLQRMLHATARMQDLITGLLSYSRVSIQEQSLKPLNLNVVVAEVLTDLDVRITETQGRVETMQLPTILADALQMRQLFQNLIGNALKYHRDKTPPVITITAATENESSVITISDNGIGFDKTNSERIFGIFQRAVGKDEYEGTGVGLAICKKIVERLGGSITATGEPGRGSVFTIRIPLKPKR